MSGDDPIHHSLTEDKVVRSEELSERAGAHWIHGSWLQVHQDGAWHKFAAFKKKCKDKKNERGRLANYIRSLCRHRVNTVWFDVSNDELQMCMNEEFWVLKSKACENQLFFLLNPPSLKLTACKQAAAAHCTAYYRVFNSLSSAVYSDNESAAFCNCL